MFPDARAIIDLLPDLVLLVSHDGRMVAANRAFVHAIGRSAEELAGQRLLDLLYMPQERDTTYLRRCAGSTQPLPGTFVFRSAAGQQIECRCEGAAIRGGEAARGFILLRCRSKRDAVSRFSLLNQKITDLTREIAARHAAEEARRESEEQFRTLAEFHPNIGVDGKSRWLDILV